MATNLPNDSTKLPHKELLAAFCILFRKARDFYQHNAKVAAPANLRRHLAMLAELHQQILQKLPAAESQSQNSDMTALTELLCWYSNEPQQIALTSLKQLLTTQLQLQKKLIRQSDLGQHRSNLLYFTASLQIAADQLAELKTS